MAECLDTCAKCNTDFFLFLGWGHFNQSMSPLRSTIGLQLTPCRNVVPRCAPCVEVEGYAARWVEARRV
jgi:hypothetical protein